MYPNISRRVILSRCTIAQVAVHCSVFNKVWRPWTLLSTSDWDKRLPGIKSFEFLLSCLQILLVPPCFFEYMHDKMTTLLIWWSKIVGISKRKMQLTKAADSKTTGTSAWPHSPLLDAVLMMRMMRMMMMMRQWLGGDGDDETQMPDLILPCLMQSWLWWLWEYILMMEQSP